MKRIPKRKNYVKYACIIIHNVIIFTYKDVLKKLFATKFDWRFILEQFLTEKLPQGSKRTWAKRRMGLSSDHPLYKGRYLHPNTTHFDKPVGIT